MNNTCESTETRDGYYHVRLPHLVQRPARKIAPERMLLGGAAAADQKADTYDWDTVFAIRFADANRSLAKPGATPSSFSASDAGSGSSITGQFGAWQLSGGDGTLLHMTVPIQSGSVISPGKTNDLSGGVATIEIQLMDLPQTPGANGTPHQVVPSTSQTVSVTNLTLPHVTDFLAKAVTQALLQQWFNSNLSAFTHTFSTINLNEKADKAQFQWMKPTAFGWAVSAQGAAADSVFGLLSMTSNRTKPNTMQISPNAIPPNQKSGFLIAQERFLEELLLPGIHTLFDGATTADFEVANDGTMIRNKNTVYMEEVELSGKTYRPSIQPGAAVIKLEANEIVVDLKKVVVDFSPGITIVMTYTCYSSIELAVNSKGEQILNYVEASPPVVDHNVEVASWVTWTEVAASVAAALITLGVGAWAKKAIEKVVLRVVAIVITLLVGELIANIAAIIQAVAEGDKDKIPPVTLMVASATDPITWPDSGDFLITSAGLNESLQFGGDPRFTN
ncbi:MAG: TULIP family P47-like protein [Planctomycetota bacterium]